MHKVMLIAPQFRIAHSPPSQYSKNIIRRAQPILGLATIATSLKFVGYDVCYLDSTIEDINNTLIFNRYTDCYGISNDEIVRRVKDFRPEIIGMVCVSTSDFPQTVNIARMIKHAYPCPIIVGGNHVTLNPTDAYNAGVFDCVFRGEADFEIVNIVDSYFRTGNLPEVTPLVRLENMEDAPEIDWSIVGLEKYWKYGTPQNHNCKSRKAILYETSRGCPENCTFCSTRQFGGSKFRPKSAGKVVREITNAVYQYGVEEVQFSDDSIGVNYNRFKDICLGLIPLGIHLCAPSGIRLYTKDENKVEELFELMKEAGFYQMTFAVESGNEYILNTLINKRINLDWMDRLIQIAKRYFKVHTFFIVGLPGETREQIQDTIDYAKRIEADSYSVSIAQPFPPTGLWKICQEQNLIKSGTIYADMLLGRSVIKRDDGIDLQDVVANLLVELNEHKY